MGGGAWASRRRPGDLAFSGTALAAGITILVLLAAVSVFLIAESVPAFTSDPAENPILNGSSFLEYVWPLVFGTIWSAILALVVAAPFAIGIALFISHYAPRRISAVLGYIIDLLAAVPSVVFGLWGGLVFAWNIPAGGEGEPSSKRQKTDAWAPSSTTKAHAQVVAGMCLANQQLWTCSWDHAVKLWDAATLEESFGGSCSVALNCIDVNNETAATGAHDGSILLWDARCRAAQKSLRGHSHQSVSSVAWLSDGRLVSAGHDGRLCVWDVRGAATEPVNVLSCSLDKCLCVSSGDGALFAGGDAPQVHRFSAPGA